MAADVRIGTAGWSIPRAAADRFAGEGTHLRRYAQQFRCAEINSSFYRPHSAATYTRWRDSTPDGFLFSVKVPRAITHEGTLRNADGAFASFLSETAVLGSKRGPLLVQLPPSLAFDAALVRSFLDMVRGLYDGPLVCEPRHASWFLPGPSALLDRYRVARVAADPSPIANAMEPEGWRGLAYFRMHGSPRKYWSRYEEDRIAALAAAMQNQTGAQAVWCIFDNTASGAAIENASELSLRIGY